MLDLTFLGALLTRDAIREIIRASEYEPTDRTEPTAYLELQKKGKWMFFLVQYLLYKSGVRLLEGALSKYTIELMQLLNVAFSDGFAQNPQSAFLSTEKDISSQVMETVASFTEEDRLLLIEGLFLASSYIAQEDLVQYEMLLRKIASRLKCRRHDYNRLTKKYLESDA